MQRICGARMSKKRIYTNRLGLPAEIVSAITKDRYTNPTEAPSDYSITKLINPIQQTILLDRYKEDMVQRDVIDLYWRFRGSVAHQVLEDAWHASMGSTIEERLYITILGKTISGKPDCYHDGEIRDYKFTKVYKIMKNDFTDWETQLNFYAILCKTKGYPVKKLTIYAFLDDWKAYDTYKKRYPKELIIAIDLPLWSDEQQMVALSDRVSYLQTAQHLSDEQLAKYFPCSKKDMWQDIVDYACMKEGAVKATRKFNTKEEAEEFIKTKPELKLVERWSARTNCLRYCDCSNHCLQHKTLLEEENGKIDTESQIF